eukprot:jgi/Mesvir1/26794/Mv20561-RA.1
MQYTMSMTLITRICRRSCSPTTLEASQLRLAPSQKLSKSSNSWQHLDSRAGRNSALHLVTKRTVRCSGCSTPYYGSEHHQRTVGKDIKPASLKCVQEIPPSMVAVGVGRAVPGYHDLVAFSITIIAATVWVKFVDYIAGKQILDRNDSRKLLHITSGPLVLLTFPFFSSSPYARYLACLVAAVNACRLALVATGALRNENMIRAIARHGNKGELLSGPLYYCLVLCVLTALFWRTSPIGVVALCCLCAGDGMADVVGRRWGASNKLWFTTSKSWVGSITMFLCGAACSIMFLAYMSSFGFLAVDWRVDVVKTMLVSLACTVAEAAIPGNLLDDNLSVPLVGVLAGLLLFRR